MTAKLLTFGQVILSPRLSFAVIPLVQFTFDRAKMGPFVSTELVRSTGWTIAFLIALLDMYLVATILAPGHHN